MGRSAGNMNKGRGTAGNSKRKCGTRALLIFKVFLSFLKLDMKSSGLRLSKEDSMNDDRPILTENSHGDNILCNRLPPKVRSL